MNTDISPILKRIRTENKLSQKDFSAKVGMKPTAYSMVESGKNRPSFDLLLKIIDVFKIDANTFFSDFIINEDLSINNDDLNRKVNDDLNRNSRPVIDSEDSLIDNVPKAEINQTLLNSVNNNLFYLEFHLLDILLNLKLLKEKIHGENFDRKEYDASQKKISNLCAISKSALKSGFVSNKGLISTLNATDDVIKEFLGKIRDLSKDIYLNS